MTPSEKPNLKPRWGLLWASLAALALWVGLLTWVFITQVVMKHA